MASSVEMNVAEDSSCGPVMLMMNKRLRALKKKLNRIAQIEEAKQQGKLVNKEQEDVLRSKTQVSALIDEYERLRQPLQLAVKEEVGEKLKEFIASKQLEEIESPNGASSEDPGAEETTPTPAAPAPAPAPEELQDEQAPEEDGEKVDESLEQQLPEIIHLLYFSQLFDVKPQGTWTKFHERTSCLSYDLVTDDDSVAHLHEVDLDALAAFGSLITSRSPNTTLSHKEALESCINHARNWLLNSEQQIESGFNITYAELRERLNRILGTEYYTMTPELQTVTRQIANAAAEHYGSGYMNVEAPIEAPQEHYVNGVDSVSNSAGNISDSSGNNADVSQDSTQVASNDNLAGEGILPDEKPQVFVQKQANNGEVGAQAPQFHQQQRYRGRGTGGYSRGRGYAGRGRGRVGQNGRQGQYYEQSGYYQQKGYYSGGGTNSNTVSNHSGPGNRRGRGGYFSSNNSNNNASNNNSSNSQAHANGPPVVGVTQASGASGAGVQLG